jgi:hypothetical protein
MQQIDSVARYRRLYKQLIRLSPEHFRHRFEQGMVQTFMDMIRDRSNEGRGIVLYALWLYAETSMEILKMNLRNVVSQSPIAPRNLGIATAIITGCLLAWMSVYVGIIGPTNNPANELFAGVLLIASIGAMISVYKGSDLAFAAWVTAAAQFLVPIIVVLTYPPDITGGHGRPLIFEQFFGHYNEIAGESPSMIGVFILNLVFVGLWMLSARLFGKAVKPGDAYPAHT